jgi:hypothetical protein
VKCVYCSNDSKYSERSAGKCPKCQHVFAFEPKRGDKLTDPAFLAAIDRVSSGGAVKWTTHHLYYEVARRTQRRSRSVPWILGVMALVTLFLGVLASPFILVLTAILVFSTISNLPSKVVGLPRSDFEGMWTRWVAAHGIPKGLIVRKTAPPLAPRGRELPEDIQHYSFDRAVVADNPETVDLLLANNFHFENNCAIFTMDGYPAEAFDTVRAMLQHNPKLSVYVLHDATAEECLVPRKLASSGWFREGTRIVDVGLRAEHVGSFKGSWKPRTAPAVRAPGLAASDWVWLSLYTLELSAIRPEQIIKRLFRAISNTSPVPQDEGGIFVDSVAFRSDATASDGGGDSFG